MFLFNFKMFLFNFSFPIFGIFLILILFVKEFLIKKIVFNFHFFSFFSLVFDSFIITIINAFSMVISAVYALFLFNRICYGNLKTQYVNIFLNISYKEFLILLPLVILCSTVSSVYSNIFLNSIYVNVNYFN